MPEFKLNMLYDFSERRSLFRVVKKGICNIPSFKILFKVILNVILCLLRRMRMLRKETNTEHLMYYVRLVDLFASCAEVRISVIYFNGNWVCSYKARLF